MRQLTLVEPNKIEWQDVPEPTLQDATDALVRPIAVARCDLDLPMAQGRIPFPLPIALGHEFVAEIIETGAEVTSFRAGQRVVVPFQIACGTCARCARGLTSGCTTARRGAMYGFGSRAGDWGGALSDVVRVPFAEQMLVALADSVSTESIVSSDNLTDALRTVGPQLAQHPNAPVLIVAGGGPSIALYAAAIALALGSERVDYIDRSKSRLQLAAAVGANTIEGVPDKLGTYPITVDCSADQQGLTLAVKSLEPGGVCTSIGIYYGDTTLPLLDMYNKSATFITGRVDARPAIPRVLALIESGRLHPERLTTTTAGWEDAPTAWLERSTKLVITR